MATNHDSDSITKKETPLDYSKFFSLNEIKKPTDIYALDVVCGGGPEPGDMIEIASPSGVGKSTLCAAITRYALPRKEKVCYLDIEKAIKTGLLVNMGLREFVSDKMGDPFVMFKPHTYALCDRMLEDAIDKHAYDHVIIDSITVLQPSKFEDASVEEMIEIGIDARIVSNLLRKWKSRLRESGTILWLVNHVRTKINTIGRGRFKKMEVTTDSAGGKALQFYCDIRLMMEAGSALKRTEDTIQGISDNVTYGNDAWIWAQKNRAERPLIKVPITIIFGRGVSNISFLKDQMNIHKLNI